MYQTISTVGGLAGYAALLTLVVGSSAISPEAGVISLKATDIVKSVEQSQALFGAKAEAISRLVALVDEYDTNPTIHIPPGAVFMAESFLRALPSRVPLPEFSIEPDGSISLDWIESRNRLFSLSIGANNRFAYAWLDGTNKGHGVENFDGQEVPKRLMNGIKTIVGNDNASIWIA